MAKKQGWPDVGNMDDFIKESNRKNFLSDFPPEDQWTQIMGLGYRVRESDGEPLVAIQGHGPKTEFQRIWVDLPNAMYLLGMLQALQAHTGAEIPREQPAPSKAHPEQ